ncbi:glycosyltransferase family 2 protein [Alphaproteobacteria bacterium]|nr:glycosyltransferase family 2 protein [Alphaproteobacteria bacterium]
MNEIKKILVMIPSFNEGDTISEICLNIKNLYPNIHIIVIDDGSKEPYENKSLIENIFSYNLPINYGLGMVTHLAIDYMKLKKYDILIRVDGDNQHPLEMIPKLIEKINLGADICIGSRSNAYKTKGLRSLLSNITRKYISYTAKFIVYNQLPNDLSSGFIAINNKTAELISKSPLERYPEPEIMMLAARSKLIIKSVKVEQSDRIIGKSSISYFRGLLLLYRFNIFLIGELLERIKKACNF